MSNLGHSTEPECTMTAAEAINAHLRVKLNTTLGQVAIAGAGEPHMGVMAQGTASGSRGEVRLRKHMGTQVMIAAAAIAVGDLVYGAASGKVSGTVYGAPIGRAKTAATANNDQIEIVEEAGVAQGGTGIVEAHTADDTLTVAESGSTHTTYGASGTVVLTLPAATVGLEYWFVVGAAQELRIDPNGTQTISLPSTGVAGAAGKYLTANAAGESVHLRCVSAGTWAVFGFTGTWTAEA